MKTLPEFLELAIRIAVNAHAGQFDKANVPYVLHPLRVMSACNTIEEKICGVIHDVVEDTEITINDFIKWEFPKEIIDALTLLTHEDGVTYKDYIMSIKPNDIARTVKIFDLRDNSDLFRLHDIEEKHLSLIKRYHWAMKYLRKESKYLTSPR